jgi:hypothetical protein
MSLAGMTTSRLAAGCEALFAFGFPEPCARTAIGTANVIASVRMFLVFIEASVLVSCEGATIVSSPQTADGRDATPVTGLLATSAISFKIYRDARNGSTSRVK